MHVQELLGFQAKQAFKKKKKKVFLEPKLWLP